MTAESLYEPVPPLACPFCSTPLVDWHGLDHGGALRQGVPGVESLPEEFVIETNCPNDGQPHTARCRTERGVWTETHGDW